MEITEKLILIAFMLAVSFSVVVGQIIAISRIHRTAPWTLIAAGMTVLAGRIVYGLVRLPVQIQQAKIRGTLPESLSWEQVILIGTAFLAVGLLIAGFDLLRRHYRNIGI